MTKPRMHPGASIAMLIGLALAVTLIAPGRAAAEDAKRPNVVMILADDLGYGDLSSYGAEDMQTPSIDALVETGMRFDRAYANSPVCSPTRAALMTGRYPDLVGVPGVIRDIARNNWGYFDPGATTLPARLSKAGYHTALVGKWHLGLRPENHPMRRGFDHFHGFLGDMMDDYYHHRRHGHNFMRNRMETIEPEGHATDLFTDWSIDYVRERADHDQPFFLYLAYNAPHTPIQPPDDWVEKVQQREPEMSQDRARLVALIEHMDAGIGRVVRALKETGAFENTLLIFISDNGGLERVGANNGPLRGQKQDMYEGGIRVPAVAIWPDHIEPGSRSNLFITTMDLMPTALEAAEAEAEPDLDGRSFLPTLLGDPQPALDDRTFIWTRREGGPAYMGQTAWALRQGPWKLVQNRPGEPFELYHLENDPQEQNNLRNEQRGKFNELARSLRAHVQRAGQVRWQKPDGSPPYPGSE